MKNNIFSFLVLLLMVSCISERKVPSEVSVKSVSEMVNASNNTLLYSLPSTRIKIDVTVEKTVSKVGPFYRYSQKMLNVTDVVTEDKVEWKIKGITVSTYGVPDINKQYAITYSGNNIAPLLNVTTEGVLYGFNSDEELDESASMTNVDYQPLPDLADVNFNAVPMLEKQLAKTSTAAMAQEAANFIYKVRKRRFKILASDFENLPPDGEAYGVVVDELDELEQSFMELFIGKSETYTLTKTFEVEPSALSDNNDVLFRFSTVSGIVDKMDVSGAPIYIELEAEEQARVPDLNVTQSKDEVRNGLFYCRPGKVIVKLIDRNELIKEQQVYLGQYGQVLSLPSSILEEENLKIRIDEKTGAIKSIKRN